MIFQVENETFSAHRIVLAATIPYFDLMFSHDMLEARQKEIIIQGIDSSSFESLLNFVYTGEIKISEGNVQSIITSASYFQLDNVKIFCSQFISQR